MDRSSWSVISKDGGIWKKIAWGTGSLFLLLSTPIAMGIVSLDLEEEHRRLGMKEPPGPLPPVDDLGKVFSSGIGPSLILLGAGFLFAVPTAVAMFPAFQWLAFFHSRSEVSPPIMSLVINSVIGLFCLAGQVLASASLPVALAQYSRGRDLRPALAVLPNISSVLEMGSPYWAKVAGVSIGCIAMLALQFIGLEWYINVPITLGICAMFFVSLVLSSRHAFGYLVGDDVRATAEKSIL